MPRPRNTWPTRWPSGWRYSKESRRPCSTPGCKHQTQTGDPRCHWCRAGYKSHLIREAA